MANTLTNLLPTIYDALDIVSREMIGFIPAASRNSNVTRASKDQTIRVPIVPAITAADITAGQLAPNTGDATIGSVSMTINKARSAPIRWNGEETHGLGTAGTYQTIMRDRFAQAFRTLVNEIETDLAAAAYKGASRAYGTAGTTPFGTINVLSDCSGVRKILDDNGAPQSDLHLVLGSAAMDKIRGIQASLWKVNEAGTEELLRRGYIDMLQGFALHNSNAVPTPTKGTGASYLVNNGAGYAVGDTAITVDTGTGTILAGDVITFTGDTNKYVVETALASNVVTIAKPGLKATLADNTALTVGNTATQNVAFHRSALQLITRLPALPDGGDSADDRTTVTDPISGISFEVAAYREYRQVHHMVGCAWGTQGIKSEHTANLLG